MNNKTAVETKTARTSPESKASKANSSAFRKVIGFAALGGAAIGAVLGVTFS